MPALSQLIAAQLAESSAAVERSIFGTDDPQMIARSLAEYDEFYAELRQVLQRLVDHFQHIVVFDLHAYNFGSLDDDDGRIILYPSGASVNQVRGPNAGRLIRRQRGGARGGIDWIRGRFRHRWIDSQPVTLLRCVRTQADLGYRADARARFARTLADDGPFGLWTVSAQCRRSPACV